MDYISFSYEKIKEIKAPAPVNTASLHPSKNFFVCGGEDFKMYKFDYFTGAEIGELDFDVCYTTFYSWLYVC